MVGVLEMLETTGRLKHGLDDLYDAEYEAEIESIVQDVAAEFACAMANQEDGPRVRWSNYYDLADDGMFLMTTLSKS